jgi:hypothetical protein
MSPTPTTTPFYCAEPGCTWAVRGVPDKYAQILAEEHAAEHAGQAPSTEPMPFRYVDEDGFCLSARLLPDLNAGGTTSTLSMTIEGSDEPQSAHVPVDELPQILAGIASAAGLERARRIFGTPTTHTETQAAPTDLPNHLQAVLTERFTALGNPFSEMRRQEKGPDGWPASHPVGPAGVAEVLRELLAAEQPTPTERAAIARVRAVLETEAVTGRSALEYRGLITGALMAAEAQQPAPAATEETTR